MSNEFSARPDEASTDQRAAVLPPRRTRWAILLVMSPILLGVGLILVARSEPACGCIPSVEVCRMRQEHLFAELKSYADQHDGLLPNSFADLVGDPADLDKESIKGMFRCLNSDAEYIYPGRGLKLDSLPSDSILLYESPDNHHNAKTGRTQLNVLQANGKVLRIQWPQAEKIITELNAGHNPSRAEKMR